MTTASGTNAYEIDFLLTVEGDQNHYADLIEIRHNVFNLGLTVDPNFRPTDIDYSITFTRQ